MRFNPASPAVAAHAERAAGAGRGVPLIVNAHPHPAVSVPFVFQRPAHPAPLPARSERGAPLRDGRVPVAEAGRQQERQLCGRRRPRARRAAQSFRGRRELCPVAPPRRPNEEEACRSPVRRRMEVIATTAAKLLAAKAIDSGAAEGGGHRRVLTEREEPQREPQRAVDRPARGDEQRGGRQGEPESERPGARDRAASNTPPRARLAAARAYTWN
jgi:hypothetical protein